jgi:integral membrane sensor domain MASE1
MQGAAKMEAVEKSKGGFSQTRKIIFLILVYFVAGKIGLALASFHPSASAFWPPSGIALAALLLMGYGVWPAIFIGAFLVNITTAGTIATSAGIAAGNALEALFGAVLVNRYASGFRTFDRPQDVFRFTFLAAGLATTASATLGVTSLTVGGHAKWEHFGPIWATWWLGDAVGALIFTPLIVLWARNPRLQWHRRQLYEAALLIATLMVLGAVVFGGAFNVSAQNYPLSFTCLPVLVWAAYRLGRRETATAVFILSLIVLSGTLQGFGPFVRESVNESIALVQVFMGFSGVLALAFAAAVFQQRQAVKRREQLIRDLKAAVAKIKRLSGLLPICASCKKIRDDKGYWTQVEEYVRDHSEAEFSHGLCPECAKKLYADYFKDQK